MKRILLAATAIAASALAAAPASAAVVQFTGSTQGCFGAACAPGGPTATDFQLVYTVGGFNQASDPTGFLGVGGVTDNLGSFTLGADAHTYTGDIFRLLVSFTQPGTGSQLYQALLQGIVTSVNGGSVFINFDNTPQLITATNGAQFTLAVNDVSVAAGGAVQILSGQLQAVAVPEPATWAMMLLGFAGIGMTIRRRRQPALAQIA